MITGAFRGKVCLQTNCRLQCLLWTAWGVLGLNLQDNPHQQLHAQVPAYTQSDGVIFNKLDAVLRSRAALNACWRVNACQLSRGRGAAAGLRCDRQLCARAKDEVSRQEGSCAESQCMTVPCICSCGGVVSSRRRGSMAQQDITTSDGCSWLPAACRVSSSHSGQQLAANQQGLWRHVVLFEGAS